MGEGEGLGFNTKVWKYIKHVIFYLCSGLFILFLFIAVVVTYWPDSSDLLISYVDAAGSVIGATLGSILAFVSIVFVVYSLQYQTNEKKRDEQELDKNRLIYFYALLVQSVEFLNSFISGIDENNEAFKEDNFRYPVFAIGNILPIKRIVTSKKQEEVYLAYKNSFKDDTILRAIGTLDVIHEDFSSMMKGFKENQLRHYKRKEQLRDLIIFIRSDMNHKKDELVILKSTTEVILKGLFPVFENYEIQLEKVANQALEVFKNSKENGEETNFAELIEVLVRPYSGILFDLKKINVAWSSNINSSYDATTTAISVYSEAFHNVEKANESSLEHKIKYELWLKYLQSFTNDFEEKYRYKHKEGLEMNYTALMPMGDETDKQPDLKNESNVE